MQAILRPSSPSNVMDWYAYPTPSFERNFCSNFTCCGQSLADLHELVDHFEEAHVVVIGPDCDHAYPSSWMCSNPDSPTSYRCVTPFARAGFADPRTRLSIETQSATHGRCTSVTRTLAAEFDMLSVTSRDLMSDSDQLCLPPSSFTARMDCSTEVEASHRDPSPFPVSCMTPRMGKKRPRAPGVLRGRGKSYKCPRQGCTKSYLNPNGLKYHLEKGTCSIKPTLHLVEALSSG